MKTYIGNAFSLNMLSGDSMIKVSESSPDCVPADAISCIGHESTAVAASGLLGRKVEWDPTRKAVSLDVGDELYVITLFTRSGAPYRAPEGVILGQEELQGLRLAIRKVTVGGPSTEQVEATTERVLAEVGIKASVMACREYLSINVAGRRHDEPWRGY